MNVPLNIVVEIRAARGIDVLFFRGLRFATSTRSPAEVVRSKGLNIVIRPQNRQEFIEKAHRALSRHQGKSDTED